MSNLKEPQLKKRTLRQKLHNIIFEADTFWGKAFDIVLLILILISIILLMLESVKNINQKYHNIFVITEWVLTVLFTIEYVLRLYSVKKPIHYAKSFYGVIDLLAILPSYLEIFISGSHYFLVIRAMRLLRVFRIFKLVQFMDERNNLAYSLRASWRKISYFLVFILLTVCVIGTMMYLIEGGHPESGFDNIPISIYWCIVTLTTVGYGDISPVTPLGQFLASVVMILGYSVIAVPTGIVTSEMTKRKGEDAHSNLACPNCSAEGHLPDAKHCYNCGHLL